MYDPESEFYELDKTPCVRGCRCPKVGSDTVLHVRLSGIRTRTDNAGGFANSLTSPTMEE
jgi:hypothetical protein